MFILLFAHFLYLLIQGAIYSLTNHENGFISGGKDGMLRMWDKNLEPMRAYDLTKALSIGQEGRASKFLETLV